MLLPPVRAHSTPGGNFGVLKSVFYEVGGFNPAMLAGEDFEFGGEVGPIRKARRVLTELPHTPLDESSKAQRGRVTYSL